MSMPASDGAHEFVVAPEVAERLGVSLHAGDWVRFEVIEGGLANSATGRPQEARP